MTSLYVPGVLFFTSFLYGMNPFQEMRKSISLLQAFMGGSFVNISSTKIRYADAENGNIIYTDSFEEARYQLQDAWEQITVINELGEITSFEKEIQAIKRKTISLKARNHLLSTLFKRLSKQQKYELQLLRFKEFLNNKDVDVNQPHYTVIQENREQLKIAFDEADINKVIESYKKPFQPALAWSKFINQWIEELQKDL